MLVVNGTTCGEAVAAAAERLAAAGVEEARLDAELLLGHLLDRSRTLLHLHAREPLAPDLAARFDALVGQRARRCPLAYLLGYQEFMGLRFAVDPRVLIPRWDSEVLVERLLGELGPRQPRLIADLCAGSGALGVSLAVHRPRATVVLTDLCPAALQVARGNATRHDVGHRCQAVAGDLAAPLAGGAGRFEAVVCNPPYIPSAVIDTLEPEVAAHEPRLALDGGQDGLAIYRRLAGQLHWLLAPGGLAAVECGSEQTEAVAGLLGGQLELLDLLTDLGRRPRGVLMRRR